MNISRRFRGPCPVPHGTMPVQNYNNCLSSPNSGSFTPGGTLRGSPPIIQRPSIMIFQKNRKKIHKYFVGLKLLHTFAVTLQSPTKRACTGRRAGPASFMQRCEKLIGNRLKLISSLIHCLRHHKRHCRIDSRIRYLFTRALKKEEHSVKLYNEKDYHLIVGVCRLGRCGQGAGFRC